MEYPQTLLTKEVIARNIKEWQVDLESDQFDQCRNKLGDSTGLCCLGVAAKTAIRLGYPVTLEPWDSGDGGAGDGDLRVYDLNPDVTDTYSGSGLPRGIAALFGLHFSWDSPGLPINLNTYQSLNDTDKKSFKEISAYIGENLLPRFEK